MNPKVNVTRSSCWLSAAATSKGHVRANNQDTYLMDGHSAVWAVADGMGGGDRGELASRMVVESLLNIPKQSNLATRFQRVVDQLQYVNRHLCCEKTLIQVSQVMGSTVVLVMEVAGQAACIWAGDSRCYLHRQGVTFQVSEDHSLIQEWMTQQQVSREIAKQHVKQNVITKAIGTVPELTLQCVEFALQPGDTLLLCSDGLYQELSDRDIHQGLQLGHPEKTVSALMSAVLRGEARDNTTIVVMTYTK